MKTILNLTFTLLFINAVIAQNNEQLIYSDVIELENVSQDDLYNRGKIWFANTYVSANDVIQLDDKSSGLIIGKGVYRYDPKVFNANARTVGVIRYTVKLFFKDGRYKYEIGNFNHESTSVSSYGGIDFGLITNETECSSPKRGMGSSWNNKVWNDIKSQIDDNVKLLISSIKDGMTKTIESNNSDW
jgi:hypothetical protein